MTWHLRIENVAGIRRADARIEPGVNAVRASNWQGKSSFLAGIETAVGTATPLTEGAESGGVVLTTDDAEFAVDLDRTNGTVSRTGTPYLRDEYDRACADLFAFLGEDNEVRRAVRDGDPLEPLLTRPLDFENVDERIARLRAERERVEEERDRAREAADRLPDLQRRVTGLEADLADLRAERAALDDGDPGDAAARERLGELHAERDRVADRVERLETTADRLRETLAATRADLDALAVPPDGAVERDLDEVREALHEVERDVELLQSVYEANRRVLDEGRLELLTDVTRDVLADGVTCWLCGADATRDEVEAHLERLDRRIDDLRTRAEDHRERAAEIESRREEVRTARRREAALTERVAEVESRLAETEESLETARGRRDDLEATIDDLAEEVDAAADRITELDGEIAYAEAELDDAREDLAEAEALAERRSTLDDEYESLTGEITALRNRKEEITRRTREAFSTALDGVLARFDTGFETARLTGTFDLVVARDGREAHLDALSEGERELLGIVAALAGHDAFDVAGRVPVMLLDGLGGLAGDNLRILVDYLRDRADYLVLTAYPEYAGFDGHELSPSDWQVVSHGPEAGAAS